jgi:hypothetical protein
LLLSRKLSSMSLKKPSIRYSPSEIAYSSNILM